MLNVIRTEPASEPEIEMDDYIPLRIRFRKGIVPVPLIWQIGDAQSLFEIEIDRQTNLIVGVTLTSYHKSPARGIPDGITNVTQTEGLPVVDATQIPQKKDLNNPFDFRTDLLEEKVDFSTFLNERTLYLVFEKGAVSTLCFRIGRVGFYEGNGKIIGLGMFELTDEEQVSFEHHFQTSSPSD